MPVYEFKCQSCGAITEQWQKMSDPYPTECPVCKTGKLEKIISATGFSLKGEGWYVTDFREKPKSSSSTTAPASETKSEPTPEAKPEASKDSPKKD